MFNLKIGLPEIASPVDIYLALFAKDLDPENAYCIKPDRSFQVLSNGLIPWKANTTGGLNEIIYKDVSTSAFPAGTYIFLMLVTPAGDLSASYLWATSFVIP